MSGRAARWRTDSVPNESGTLTTDYAIEVENLAGQYLALLAAGLAPVLLSEEELQTVIDKFAQYGRLEAR